MIRFILFVIYSQVRRVLKPIYYFLLCLLFVKKWQSFFDCIDENRYLQVPSIFNTLYLNLRCLSLRQAMRVPIYVYHNVDIMELTGTIEVPEEAQRGTILIGFDWGYRSKGNTRIRISGKIFFKGSCIVIRGANICVFPLGTLSFGDDNLIGENTLIYCMDSISIGDHLRLTYESQIFDSDFHYTVNLNTYEIKKKTSPVSIGNNVWIGNRANIKKGVKIPDYTIIAASGSLLTKDYTGIVDKFGCLGGYPAKPLPVKSCRTWKNESERMKKLDAWFASHPESECYHIGENESIEDYIGTILE